MAIREKAKALFKSKGKSDRDSQTSKSSSGNSDKERWPSNVYKPEEMPRPKYRAPPKKEHKEKLESFSFGDSWRRKSFQSQYSPMGTRAPSRRNSLLSMGRKSFSGKTTSRTNSVASVDGEKGEVRHREYAGAARPTALQNQVEEDGDDDVGNVGLSRIQSKDHGAPAQRPRNGDVSHHNQLSSLRQTMSTAHDHQPFSENDLALAMQRSHLAVPAH